MTERLDGLTVNCGLYADEVARLHGDDSFEICPPQGRVLRLDGIEVDRILMPPPTRRTRGVLVFPTIDGKVVAGPTAVDQTDKEDWSVRPEALDEVRAKAAELLPAIADAEPIGSGAGLRPRRARGELPDPARLAGADQRRRHPLDRAHGSLGIAEYVAEPDPGAPRVPLPTVTVEPSEEPWWHRS